jgi:urease accessory protein
MNRVLKFAAFGVPALLLAGAADAHTGLGHAAGFVSGFIHPLLGLDHLIAMLAAGVFAGKREGVVSWRSLPMVLASVGAGMLVGAAGAPQGAWTVAVAGSGLLIGLALLLDLRVAASWFMASAVVFGLIHGHAHGAEIAPAAVGMGAQAAGLLASTALLLGFGAACGAAGRAYPSIGEIGVRAFGGAVSVAALFLAVT